MCSDEEIYTSPHMDVYLSSNTDNTYWMAHYSGIDGIVWAQFANESASGFTLNALPDIVLDRNNAPTDIKGVAFHEMTHANHFTNVGSDWYQHLTHQEFVNGRHGNSTEPGAGYGGVTIPCQTIVNRYIGMNWGWGGTSNAYYLANGSFTTTDFIENSTYDTYIKVLTNIRP